MARKPIEALETVENLPDAPNRGYVPWEAMVAKARANPTQWVKSPVSVNPSVVTQIKNGRYAAIDGEEFDFATRIDPDRPEGVLRSFVYIKVRA